MFDLKACTVCLKTNVKIYNLNSDRLRHEYNLMSGLMTYSQNGLPEYLCYQCMTYVRKFKKFRDKCQHSYYLLREVFEREKEITESVIEKLSYNVMNIEPNLSYLALDHYRTKCEYVRSQTETQLKANLKVYDTIPILQFSTTSDEVIFEVPKKKTKIWEELDDSKKQEDDDTLIKPVETYVAELTELYEKKDDDYFDEFDDYETQNEFEDDLEKLDVQVETNGQNHEEEYATLIPITTKEAKAAVEVYKMLSKGKYSCEVCQKTYNSQYRFKAHLRMHDMVFSGTFSCSLCKFYYRSELLLKSHMTEKHMYKYLCKKCPEVNFDRRSAKHHYYWGHFTEIIPKHTPTTKLTKGKRKHKSANRQLEPKTRDPDDFPILSAITQEEQYALITDRQKTKNYIDSPYKCEYCFKGFRVASTYDTHLRTHDPNISGKFQCDVCKTHYPNTAKINKHITRCHLYKYTCQMCGYVCLNRCRARLHYNWHKKVVYPCPHCKKEFSKNSTKLGHIRKMHPSTNICNLCGHSFVSVTGLHMHKLRTHSKEEVEENPGNVDPNNPLYCADCCVQFRDDDAFNTHLGSSNKHAATNRSLVQPKKDIKHDSKTLLREAARLLDNGIVNTRRATSSNCDICNKYLRNDTQATRHYDAEHPGAPYLKRYMCDICGHKTRVYANLVVHMRTHTQEKPYACPHCDRRFSTPNNRDRHIVVHTGEKRYQCAHCNRRFAQKSTVKLHIQTVHMKIPYPPWNKKTRKRRRELESATPSPGPLRWASLVQPKIDIKNDSKTLLREAARLLDNGIVNTRRATSSNCDICNKYLRNDTQATRHYDAEHPGAPYLKRYMCDICGHKTRVYANLMVHMRTHTQEKPYACPHCDRRFSKQNNRERHIVVHTGEKRYQCAHCNRCFAQKSTVRLHIQTVHMKIPYPPWNKKTRKRRIELESATPSSHPHYKVNLDASHGSYLSAYIDSTNKACGSS